MTPTSIARQIPTLVPARLSEKDTLCAGFLMAQTATQRIALAAMGPARSVPTGGIYRLLHDETPRRHRHHRRVAR